MLESPIFETILLFLIGPVFFVDIPIIRNNRFRIVSFIMCIIGILMTHKMYLLFEDWRVCIPMLLYCFFEGTELYSSYKYRKLMQKREEEENNDT